jgi:4-amino-4-deoxy-L-arabinose transferase-like glycosyltransferase
MQRQPRLPFLLAQLPRHHRAVNTQPNPALVTQASAERLPRLPLLLLCAAYVLPGLVGRDPWRSSELTSFGVMLAMAEGRTGWFAPALGGVPVDAALLPHWIGAFFIWLLSPGLDPALAARLPFAALLALTLMLTWYSAFHLARTEAAQPLPFAFGGEASTVDYARALADGAVLALMATLGALQLGHETTPELSQLCAAALALWALAAAPYRDWRPRLAALAALPLLAASGAPVMALAIGIAGSVICFRSHYPEVRRFAPWVVAGTLLGALLALALHTWAWRIGQFGRLPQWTQVTRLLLWFLWPAWLLALWTLWRWRRQWQRRHITVPLAVAGTALAACIAMGGSDRALLVGLPAFAVLAAFALPTLKRSASAAIDWFSVFFFTACALAILVIYVSMQTGVPAKPLANIIKLAPGFEPQFSLLALLVALSGTAAWLSLVRWRTGRHRQALWKSLVLPAAGVALSWLLLMTLWLPLLDYARGMRPWADRIATHLPRGDCIAAPGLAPSSVAALEHHARAKVDARATAPRDSGCGVLLLTETRGRAVVVPAGWQVAARVRRPTERDERTVVLRRAR